MPSRFPPLADQPPVKIKARLMPELPWAELALSCLIGLLLLG